MEEISDHYSTLGVGRDASPVEIKKAYRKLALENHPDKGGTSESLQPINEAYRVLSDIDEKREYDMEIAQLAETEPEPEPEPEYQSQYRQQTMTTTPNPVYNMNEYNPQTVYLIGEGHAVLNKDGLNIYNEDVFIGEGGMLNKILNYMVENYQTQRLSDGELFNIFLDRTVTNDKISKIFNDNNGLNAIFEEYNSDRVSYRVYEYSVPEEGDCVICQDNLSDRKWVKLDCGHKFHEDCIKEWAKIKSSCPSCRKVFDLEQIQTVENILKRIKNSDDLKIVIKVFKSMIKDIIFQKLEENIFYFLGNRDFVSKYFLKYLLEEFFKTHSPAYRNQAMIRYLYMFCLDIRTIKRTIEDIYDDYIKSYLVENGIRNHRFKMPGTSETRNKRYWLEYKNNPESLTDDIFLEGIINEIKKLRILKELIDIVLPPGGGFAGDTKSEDYETSLRNRGDDLYILIFKFIEKGATFNPNPRRSWVFENEFESKCKVLLNEFENTGSERNGIEQYTLKDIAGDEIKYFVKIDIGSKMKPDFQAIEARMCEEMRRRLREFTDITYE